MDKENGEDPAAKPPPDGLLDPSGLFGAYWGREGASAAQAQAQAQAALFGFGSRYPPPTTLGVAANQAASLSLHPAASAAWWSMASHLAAQDYLARLQASGLSFPPLGDPYAALSALAAGKHKQKTQRNDGSGRGSSAKEKPPATSTSSQPTIPDWGSSYGFPPSSTPSGSLSSLASLNSLAQQPHSKHKPPTNRKSSSASKEKESRDLMLAHSAYHAALTKGKGMSSLYPFGTPDKDRRGIDSFTGLPHTILSAALEGGDPSSVLGGVRLPPDTEIIKYTSSLAGPKLAPGSTTRGRKKTISLDPPRVSVHPASPAAPPTPNKRQKVDEFGNSRSSVEVIRLPSKPDRNNVPTPPPNLSDYAGISRELLQTIASQSGVSLAALERQLQPANNEPGLNLSTKSANNSEDTPLDLGLKDEDTPLNLSLKPTPPNTQASDALSRLTSLSSSLSASNDRISRRKPGAKPRRVAPDAHDSPRPKSSGSEDSESLPTWPSREGRPRNLGRGVSKPKKNTVASLLAQSRALGLRPALAQQLLAETDIDKLRVLLGETASTDSECPSDSNPSDSDTSDGGKRSNDPQLRLPLALGWKRVTVIKGLSRNCNIKGDVSYTPPEPNTGITIRTADELNAFLESNPSAPLSRDSFSFSARVLLGEYVQHTHEEPVVMTETEITKRLEEARALAALSGRPTPPPLERRMELARRQQAARDARRDGRGRDQARLVREIERSEKAEVVKREKEARSAQLLEQINKSRSQLTIEALPQKHTDEWKIPEIGPVVKNRDKTMPQISLSLIPVSGLKDSPIKTLNLDQNWKGELEEYNALDKMKDFAEKASFDLPKRPNDKYFDFSLTKTPDKRKAPDKENNLDKLIESYSRITEFINGCDWSKLRGDKKADDPKSLEQKYLDAKNEFMSQNLMLMPKDGQKSVLKEVIDLSGDDDILKDIITKKINRGTFHVGKDGALSISVQPCKDASPAKKRKQEELEKQKMEDQAKRQQEREIKRQQAMLLKEQQKYITEERERRRQHTAFIRQLDARRRWEDRERRKHQNLLDRLLAKEKKLQQRRKEMELLAELRRPQEDSSLSDHKPLPKLDRIPGLRIPGQAMADLLQVYEFLHNFGQALGFEVESLPTLDTLQMGLIPTCSQEAEDELMSVLTKLLVVAIEEPGIPHPGRHTTLLGHALRLAELTPDTLSEVLRIYLYACATAEVKALTGLTVERERDRRVADHHQSDAEMQMTFASSKNTTYYEHLHSNATYKLSELLRDKPFASLPPSSKCRMMARVCDELLQSRSVLRQLDSSLEHLAQLRRDRYLLDTRIRKVRVLQQRKARAEAAERQQAAALDRMHRMVDDSHTHAHETEDKPETPKKESSPDKQHTPSPFKDESDKELSPLKDLSKKMLNNNKDDDVKDKDDVMADCDGLLSDLESEGTQPEEDEDKNLSSEELSRKLEKLLRQSEQQLLALAAGSHELRATCYGQDRYWRRYWSLGKAGGVLVEALESAQPETIDYHDRRERAALAKEDTLNSDNPDPESVEVDAEAEAQELRSIKNELNLSDRTQIIKYEPNVTHGVCKVEGSIKMEEKYIQHKQSNEEEDMLDIEDSIPTAFLVQKPTHKPMFAQQAEQIDKPQEIVKVENIVKSEAEQEEEKENTVNNLEELRKMAEAVSSELNAAKKAEADKIEMEAKMEETKQAEVESAHSVLYTKMLEGKWFSILRHESSFLNDINDKHDIAVFCDNEHTCSEVINCQGHKWDVSNNLHLLNDPSLFTLNSMVTSVQVPANNVYADSSLTMSGIDQDELDSSLGKDAQDVDMEENKELETDVDKEVQSVTKDISQKTKASNLSSLGLLNFNALSTYVTCDSPPPIQMTADELEQLENAKIHGLPKKVEGSYVPKELRHGWWRISRPEQLQELLEALHPRGARERELQAALTQHPPTINNKLYIDPGSPRARLTTPADLSEEGYPPPDTPGSFCALTARRVDMQLLAMVEALEERVAAASMQVKGWRAARLALPAAATGAEIVARARHKLASLEAHIERRYLKPPLVQRYVPDGGRTATESSSEVLGAALQADGTAHSDAQEHKSDKGISRGLCVWREAVSRCNTSAQLAMLLHALEHAVAWDKSIMKANCQFCLSGDNEDQLLLCDGCDKGYHTYCFKPRMEKIPDGDWYCWECVNKARGGSRERVCIVCGGAARGRALPCALCVRAYHLDCHYPPLTKMPRGKWYCSQCASRAPARRPRKGKKDKNKDSDLDGAMVPSPAASHASTSTTAEEGVLPAPEPERDDPDTDGLTHNVSVDTCDESHASGNGALLNDTNSEDHESENLPLLSRAKKEKNSAKKQLKDMQFCKNLLCEMECHEHAWPFLVPVNTKQFPQYRKVIKSPMDLSTIKRKLHESGYKCKEEFASDVRLIFSNCEVFNEDESPVGRAGHCMREFFERRWEHA
ncbi:uncharacterized protein LOC116776136 isoform X2 [Danaus plexippus]|uniref:uncharacterized protein LOC116776136 isoform X2 n=1 Tax=Danaus plexippus TaxID=13037 RepID=UPI002AAF6411|nr:uncharacterized protein LOC116776136 isoform X2 [Danaus plexippus]